MNSEYSSDGDWVEKKKYLLQEFDDLLDSIDSAGTKEKILWRQIYENSITDRANANICFLDVLPHLTMDMDNHMQVGMQAVQYLTRMEKSNEQLIKLATLIQKSLENQVADDEMDPDAIFAEIQKSQQIGD